MRNLFMNAVLGLVSTLTWAQAGSQAAPPAKPGSTAKAPVHHAATGQPTAILETSVGNMTCTLFPDKAPVADIVIWPDCWGLPPWK